MGMNRIRVVAEIGCNHNGDKNLAKKMVAEAQKCGVDAVKFQTFNSETLVSRYAPKADYQIETTGENESQLEMIKKLELSHQELLELFAYANELGLDAFSTPFDMDSIEFLFSAGQKTWKIPSGEITNLPYLRRIGSLIIDEKEVILSSGMATIEEINTCIRILVEAGTKEDSIILLHCNTEYPSPDEDVNLSAIMALKEKFPNLRIGFSDHSVGSVAAIAASTMGIVMIEKHFTLDKNLPGPDHKASATPDELREICEGVHRVETMYGRGEKIVTQSERKNKFIARKSIVAKRQIEQGEIFCEENITCKRPGNGISAIYWDDLLGQKAERAFSEDELIEHSSFIWEDKKQQNA